MQWSAYILSLCFLSATWGATEDPIQEAISAAARAMESGELMVAESALRSALAAAELPANSQDKQMLVKAMAHESLATILALRGQDTEAMAQLQQVIQLRTKTLGPNNELTLHARANLTTVELAAGKLGAARTRAEDLLRHPALDFADRIALLQTIAAINQESGNVVTAAQIIEQLRPLLQPDAPMPAEVRLVTRLNCAHMATEMGLFDLAEAELAAIRVEVRTTNPRLLATWQIEWAEMAAINAENAAAEIAAPAFADLRSAGLSDSSALQLTVRWAGILLRGGRAEQAFALLESAALATKNQPVWSATLMADFRMMQGEAGWRADRGDPAASVSTAATIWRRQIGGDHPQVARAERLLALLALDRLDSAQALKHATAAAAAERAELHRLLRYGTDEQKVPLIADLRPFNLPCTLGDTEQIVEQCAAFRSVVTDALVTEARNAARARRNGLEQQWTRRTELRQTLARPAAMLSLEARSEITRELATVESSLGLVEVALRPFDYASLQQALPGNAALIEYVRYDHYIGRTLFEPRFGAIVITHDRGPVWCGAGAADVVEAQVAIIREGRNGTISEAQLKNALARLGEQIWKPVKAHIGQNVTRLFIVPDGVLQLTPFAVLPDSESERLLDQFEIVTLGSARDLVRPPSPPTANPWVLVGSPAFTLPGRPPPFAEASLRERNDAAVTAVAGTGFAPLPGTMREIADLRTIAPPDARWFESENATEAAVVAALQQAPSLVHLATHGFLLDPLEIELAAGAASGTGERVRITHPLQRSGLALAGINNTLDWWRHGAVPEAADDGILTAAEIASLNLTGTRLVVLSACDTGRGRIVAGEGVLGLRRAFQCAGTSSLVITLWAIADTETVDFMHDFYAALSAGQAPCTAFSETQRKHFHQHGGNRAILQATYLAAPFVFCGFDASSSEFHIAPSIPEVISPTLVRP